MTEDNPTQSDATPDGARTGVWLIGARGSVATTAVAGCAALASGMHPPTGMVTETDAFAGSGLPPLGQLVFGGHDTASCPLPKRAEHLVAGGVLPHGLPAAVYDGLAAADACIRPGGPLPGGSLSGGPLPGGSLRPSGAEGEDPREEDELIDAFAADITAFTRDNALARTIVVNVASTEGSCRGDDAAMPPSSRYAAAALRAGCPYVNFTPSTGLHHPRLRGEAGRRGLPHAGRDGKTGQTLLRSVLAPMFAQRALPVRAWSGTNLLGGGDGSALADPGAAAAKNAGKERVLADNLGGLPEGQLHIDDVPALGDWKTAWDHVAFDGFLGSRMILQTVWQGCDSALAAPLVLDLARIVARAHEAGIEGAVDGLGFYFKDPDSGPADLPGQWHELLALAGRLRAAA
ncbi:inositol-3-phosphate synthase [Streptomyces sp. WMMB 322]|uniref:inositol-3-phosphate synthase n=1 Tax=Streptomyces sp. WMMB 322 TaxID=1286821 RepID=UPI0006E30F17|nr:inositol-3-phosphate synthase [Streptomyces sp. WMMB 322]SCK35796.1 myo-inositol-1-phosphate synthase [Streptomyces sp. WMMB 322]